MGPPGPDASWYPSGGQLRGRELGTQRPSAFAQGVRRRRRDAASLSGDKLIAHKWHGGVNCLELDGTERRYLLAGTVDAVVAVYDVEVPSATDAIDGRETHDPVLRVAKGDGTDRRPGHAFGVSAAAWYPKDTGAFFTGSFDGTVGLWDTNHGTRVTSVSFTDRGAFESPDPEIGGKVYAVAVVPSDGDDASNGAVSRGLGGATHGLVACGTGDPRVRLWDPVSGAITHVLAGHRGAVWAAAWARGSEYVLMTGGGEGSVRVWDVRTAGALASLDASRVFADFSAGDANQKKVGAWDQVRDATCFSEDRSAPVFVRGPAPASRRMEDNVPAHLRSFEARVARGGASRRGDAHRRRVRRLRRRGARRRRRGGGGGAWAFESGVFESSGGVCSAALRRLFDTKAADLKPANDKKTGRDKKTRSRLGARTRGGSRRSRFRRTACVWRPRERTIACASGTSPAAFTRTCETSATPPTTRARRRSSPSTRPARVCTTPPPKGTCSFFRAAPTDDGFRPSRGVRKAKAKPNPRPIVKQRCKARAAARPETAGPEAAAVAAGARRRGDEKRVRRRACTACFAGISRRRALWRRTPTRRRCTPAARTGTFWYGARP